MPELPEVETIVRSANKKVVGYKIVDFWTDWSKSVKVDRGDFGKIIKGAVIKEFKRRGKNILMYLDNGHVVLIHLKMTGHLLFKDEDKNKNKYFQERVNQYIRHIWKLEKESKKATLEFSDLRKFGKIKLILESDLEKEVDFKNLGIEPLSDDFSLDFFKNLIAKRSNKNIKILLMDQSEIAGIGNIYASEILFESGISPLRLTGTLTSKETEKLFDKVKEILKKAIKLRGTSDSDYRDINGSAGEFQKVLKVYGREKEKCFCCLGKIERVKIGQRSTFWCKRCQK